MSYRVTQINPENMNEFEHRQVVFTRVRLPNKTPTMGDHEWINAIKIWDVKTDQLMLTLEDHDEEFSDE